MKIAIDGPSGSGKSTIAKRVAKRLHIQYIDTGAMFRALTYSFLKKQVKEEDEVKKELKKTSLEVIEGGILLNGLALTKELRTPEVDKEVSYYSAMESVRTFLKEAQRMIAEKNDVIMDGRDIGTVVFPDAEFKFYLDASVEERARRRALERNDLEHYEEILEDMKRRDHYDSTREIAPLKKACDAIAIDTDHLSIEEVEEKIIEVIHETKTTLS
ncbi:(d)CMP kinase [Guggenheimella bovis]